MTACWGRPEDFARLSDAAWWLGRTDVFLAAGEACFRRHMDGEQSRDAAMTAVELAVALFLRGEEALGSGWMARAQRLLADLPEGPEHGYVRYVTEVEGALDGTDLEAVAAAARAVQELGRRHGDPNLVAGGLVGEGRALVRRGDAIRGMPLLDEAMLAVLDQDLAPEWAGNVYCHLMATCHELADIASRPGVDGADAGPGCPGCRRPCCSPGSAGSTVRRSTRSPASGTLPSARHRRCSTTSRG